MGLPPLLKAPSPPSRLLGSVTRLLDSVLLLVHGRLALLSVEAQVGGLRLVALVVWAVMAVLALMMGLGFLVAALTVALWDGPYRLLALLGATVLFLGLGALAVRQAKRSTLQMSAWFEATLNELRLDRERLSPHLPPPPSPSSTSTEQPKA
ncbi:MAG: hypothetical protein RLZZ612_369 [Pseudomonadota bacterium]|jgi:uncharacterized membrane protein YqjE